MKRVKLNDKGSAIVSVIVVTAFITILATTILYITGMNYMVKQNDYQNKMTFYKAEEVLDGLKAMLAADVSAACDYAYRQTLEEYVSLANSSVRTEYYRIKFVEYMDALWNGKDIGVRLIEHRNIKNTAGATENPDAPNRAAVLIAQYSAYSGIAADEIRNSIVNSQDGESDIGFEGADNPSAGQFIITGIISRYTDDKGYTTYIKTDIVMNAPAYNWGEEYASGDSEDGSGAEGEGGADLTLRMSDYIVYRNWEKY